jgi:hypothetical protein
VPPVKASAYKCGEAWSTLVHHRPADRRLLIQGSAGFIAGTLAGRNADVVYLGVGRLGLEPERYLVDYWSETVGAVGARRVVLIHWDDFFRPLSRCAHFRMPVTTSMWRCAYSGDWPPMTPSRCICPRSGNAPTRGTDIRFRVTRAPHLGRVPIMSDHRL